MAELLSLLSKLILDNKISMCNLVLDIEARSLPSLSKLMMGSEALSETILDIPVSSLH
jgi:hypothetical protein